MKNIDFLPEIYRERSKQHHARIWWVVVLVIFGSAISFTASIQFMLRRNVQRHLEELEPQFAAAKKLDRQLLDLQSQTNKQSQSATLYTYLKHPWPRTQILAAIVSPLPDSIRLTEVRLAEQAQVVQASDTPAPRRRNNRNAEAAEVKLAPAEYDLEELRKQYDGQRVVIDISGFAKEVGELRTYVDQLSRNGFVASAQLKSLEAVSDSAQAGQTRFDVHLVLHPGYGQAGGPEPKNIASTPLAQGGQP